MSRIFHADTEEEFKKITAGIAELSDEETALPELLERIIGQQYIQEKERMLRALEGERGTYIPLEEGGGGDFWIEEASGVGVGSTKLLDVIGHGVASLPTKILVMRMIELYKKARPENEAHVFAAIDEFLADLPGTQTADYAEVRLGVDDGVPYCDIEVAGGIEVLIRDNESGEVMRGSEVGYPPLGFGEAQRTKRKLTRTVIPRSADVYIASDGLFDLAMDNDERFGKQFQQFCEERKKMSAEEFRGALMDVIAERRAKGRVRDDITVIILKNRP